MQTRRRVAVSGGILALILAAVVAVAMHGFAWTWGDTSYKAGISVSQPLSVVVFVVAKQTLPYPMNVLAQPRTTWMVPTDRSFLRVCHYADAQRTCWTYWRLTCSLWQCHTD